MFSKSKSMARSVETNPENGINRIVEGTFLEGNIRSESSIRIDGTFKGDINTKGRVVVGPSGKIEGNVQCQNSDVEGYIKGKLSVQELLTLKSTAKIDGDIYTDKLSIEPGAHFSGTCSMGGKVKEIKKADATARREEVLEEQTA